MVRFFSCLLFKISIFLELQLTQPESIKSEAFGASNKTFPLIPIVIFQSLNQFLDIKLGSRNDGTAAKSSRRCQDNWQ